MRSLDLCRHDGCWAVAMEKLACKIVFLCKWWKCEEKINTERSRMNVSQFLTHSSSGGFHLHSNLGLSSCVECGQRFFILKLRDTSQGFPRKDLSVLKIFPFPPQLRRRLCKRVHKDGTQTCRCFYVKMAHVNRK